MCFLFVILFIMCVVFFKQKTAYDMRISDWSSDVCSSDLDPVLRLRRRWLQLVPVLHLVQEAGLFLACTYQRLERAQTVPQGRDRRRRRTFGISRSQCRGRDDAEEFWRSGRLVRRDGRRSDRTSVVAERG